MLYFFYGDNILRRKEKIKKLIDVNGVAPRELKIEELTTDFLEELAWAQGLFDKAQVFFLRDILESKELKDFIKKEAAQMAKSPNIFVISEMSATKDLSGSLEKKGAQLIECTLAEKPVKKEANNFALGDAIGRRDRKASWVLYQEALARGAFPEEIHGIVFWVMKNIFLAKTGGATGLAPYPLMKAKSFEPKWNNKEIKNALSELVRMYHDSHRGLVEFPIALEKFLLETV